MHGGGGDMSRSGFAALCVTAVAGTLYLVGGTGGVSYANSAPVAALPLLSTAATQLRPLAASPYASLTAASLDAAGLTYVGPVTVPTPTGDVPVLRFTVTQAALADLTLSPGCASGGSTTVTTAGAATLGNTTFDLVGLDATLDGTPVQYTVADPPTGPFPARTVLRDVTLSAATISAATLTLPSPTTEAARC
jgi:hypothetical protein